MSMNLTCTQVSALLSFYIDGKLSSQLTQFVEAHIAACPTCKLKLEALKNMLFSLRAVHERLDEVKLEPENNSEELINENLKMSLSAYIDNELSDSDNIKVKKNIISNAKVRGELENMYVLKKILHNSFEKTKNELREDYSKLILRRIDMQEEIYGSDSFAKVVALFIIIFTVFTITAVLIFGV